MVVVSSSQQQSTKQTKLTLPNSKQRFRREFDQRRFSGEKKPRTRIKWPIIEKSRMRPPATRVRWKDVVDAQSKSLISRRDGHTQLSQAFEAKRFEFTLGQQQLISRSLGL